MEDEDMREIYVIRGDRRVWVSYDTNLKIDNTIYTTDNLNYAKVFNSYAEAEEFLPFVIKNSWEEYFNIEKYYMA